MSKRALLVYNICGIKKDNTNVYPRFMQGIRNQYQNFSGEIKTIISGCKTHSHTMPTLKSLFPEFDYLEVNDNLTNDLSSIIPEKAKESWIFKIQLTNNIEIDELMDEKQYIEMIS